MKPSVLKKTIQKLVVNPLLEMANNGGAVPYQHGTIDWYHNTLLLAGAPGVGKSDVIAQVANENGMRFIIFVCVTADPTDVKGMPLIVDGQPEFVPFGEIRDILDSDVPTLFLFEDLGQARPATQAASMQPLLGRHINGVPVSNMVAFIGATNRVEDKSGVQGILECVKSRFTSIIPVEPDLNDSLNWWLENGMPPEMVAFMRFRGKREPHLFFAPNPSRDMVNTPNPRTITNAGKASLLGLDPETELEVFTGCCGKIWAQEYVGWLQIYRDLPNLDLVMKNPETAEVPTDPAVLYALTGALAGESVNGNFDSVIQYANRLPDEFSTLLVVDATKRRPELLKTAGFIKWADKHEHVTL